MVIPDLETKVKVLSLSIESPGNLFRPVLCRIEETGRVIMIVQ